MPATNTDGPVFIYGNMGALPAGYGDATPDPNQDAGPSMTFQGDVIPDVRYAFMKDKVQGYTGVVPAHTNHIYATHVDTIPATLGSALIAPLQTVANGVPMTLAATQATGIAPGVPIRPNTSPFALNSGNLTTVVALDFGFAFGNCTAGSATIVVADTTQAQFIPGEPVVIPGAGPGGTALLTNVLSIVDGTHITVGPNIPATTINNAPIGTGNLWGPSPVGFPVPDSALPYLAAGPAIALDPRQSLMRCVSASGVSGGAGGTIRITGYDVYGQLQTANIVLAAGANTVFSAKTFKYILSAVPQFTDATHNYSIGTGDTFGFVLRTDALEYLTMFYNGTFNAPVTGTATGWTAADTTNPATTTTGDVRGTWQVSSSGAGTVWGQGSGPAASNGTISGLALTGRRLALFQTMRQINLQNFFPSTPQFQYGVIPA